MSVQLPFAEAINALVKQKRNVQNEQTDVNHPDYEISFFISLGFHYVPRVLFILILNRGGNFQRAWVLCSVASDSVLQKNAWTSRKSHDGMWCLRVRSTFTSSPGLIRVGLPLILCICKCKAREPCYQRTKCDLRQRGTNWRMGTILYLWEQKCNGPITKAEGVHQCKIFDLCQIQLT